MTFVSKIDFPIMSMWGAGVEFIAVINEQGRVEEHVCKSDIPLGLDKKEIFFMGLRLQKNMQADFDEFLGPADYTVTRRGNLKFVSVPFYSKIIFAVLDKEKNHHNIVRKIAALAKSVKAMRGKISKEEEMNN